MEPGVPSGSDRESPDCAKLLSWSPTNETEKIILRPLELDDFRINDMI